MNILITGGAGFVGRHFAKYFLDRGDSVTLVDDLSSGIHPSAWMFKPGRAPTFYHQDVRHWFRYHSASRYDLILHLAAVVGGRLTIEGEPLRVATDLAIDSDFFNWLLRTGCRGKVVYFSSSAVYPVELQTRQTHCNQVEDFVRFDRKIGMPDLTYGWAKLTGEYLAQTAVRQGLDVAIYRPFSGYGEDQSLDYPFPSIIKRVVEQQRPIVVWGSGHQARDFIHIDDVVDAVLTTLQIDPGTTLNLGSGIGTSFFQLVEQACVLAGVSPEAVNLKDKPEGVFYRVADTWRLSKHWRPKISLEEGIKRALDAFGKT